MKKRFIIKNGILSAMKPTKKVEKIVEDDLDNLDLELTDDDSGWGNTEDDLKVVSTCGRKPEAPLNIIFSRVVKNKIDILMKKYPSCEWLAYLVGDANTRYITDMVLPKQEVSTGAVHVIGGAPTNGIIGVIHSHHNMGAFFSGTDNNYINGNYDISVVVAHNGIKSQVRWVTPCGYKVVSDGNVIIESENLFDEAAFINQVDSVVERNVIETGNGVPFYKTLPDGSAKYVRGFNDRCIKGMSSNASFALEDATEDMEDLKELLTSHYKRNNS